MDDRTPILKVRPADVTPKALVCGDPERAKQSAESLENAQVIDPWREYATYTGEYRSNA